MNTVSCAQEEVLLSYWLGELDDTAESALEEHLFGCARCSARLQALVQLGNAVRKAFLRGEVSSVLAEPLIARVRDAGLRVREYRMKPGGSVNCTVAPGDDLVVAHLQAPLADVSRLDVVFEDLPAGPRLRTKDVAFDPAAGQVTLLPHVTRLRQLRFATQRVKLIAVEGESERVIADYTFNHSPYDSLPAS